MLDENGYLAGAFKCLDVEYVPTPSGSLEHVALRNTFNLES